MQVDNLFCLSSALSLDDVLASSTDATEKLDVEEEEYSVQSESGDCPSSSSGELSGFGPVSGIHATQYHAWQKQLFEGAAVVFERKQNRTTSELGSRFAVDPTLQVVVFRKYREGCEED